MRDVYFYGLDFSYSVNASPINLSLTNVRWCSKKKLGASPSLTQECGYQIPNCEFVTGGRNLSYQDNKGDIRPPFWSLVAIAPSLCLVCIYKFQRAPRASPIGGATGPARKVHIHRGVQSPSQLIASLCKDLYTQGLRNTSILIIPDVGLTLFMAGDVIKFGRIYRQIPRTSARRKIKLIQRNINKKQFKNDILFILFVGVFHEGCFYLCLKRGGSPGLQCHLQEFLSGAVISLPKNCVIFKNLEGLK